MHTIQGLTRERKMKKDRRAFIKNSPLVAALALSDVRPVSAMSRPMKKQTDKKWPLTEGPDTPKMVLSCPVNADVKAMRKLKQIGINYVSTVWGPGPWKESELRGYMDAFEQNGLKLINLMYIVKP